MEFHRCDKCGKEIDEMLIGVFTIERDTRLMHICDDPKDFNRRVELCPQCVGGLLELVNGYLGEGCDVWEVKHDRTQEIVPGHPPAQLYSIVHKTANMVAQVTVEVDSYEIDED